MAPPPTLPPQIRNFLNQPDTPAPRARSRRRIDANGRRLPAGPAPPASWLEASRHAPPEYLGRRHQERVYPTDLGHLPGLPDGLGQRRRLQDICLRQMARYWEFIREYDQNYLAEIPTRLRMALLSAVAVYGPDDGVSFDGLKTIIMSPDFEPVDGEGGEGNIHEGHQPSPSHSSDLNETFFRLDLSGSMANSISFKQLTTLLKKPEDTTAELSWEETLPHSLNPAIPTLTHLSISHPSPSISWTRLLAFARHIPGLTHLSLAHWPVPSLTPNAKTAVMTNPYGKDVQYGGTNYYSHTLENDFREAAELLNRLAGRLYLLEYLDVSGCMDWVRALRWAHGGDAATCIAKSGALVAPGAAALTEGIAWRKRWLKLRTLRMSSGSTLSEDSPYRDVVRYVRGVKEAWTTEDTLAFYAYTSVPGCEMSKRRYINVEGDDWRQYKEFWKGEEADAEDKKKRVVLDSLDENGARKRPQWMGSIASDETGAEEELAMLSLAETTSAWDQ